MLDDGSGLVHYYCSTSTFLSLFSKKEIWLTSLRDSNDSLEGKWVLDRFVTLRTGGKDQYFDKAWHILNTAVHSGQYALGMCFSEHRDRLSQWRGYAEDGRGFSIGFSKEKLDRLSKVYSEGKSSEVKFRKINYWDRLPDEFLIELKAYCDKQSYSSDGNITQLSLDNIALQDWIWRLNEIKNPAFKEEAEHRLYTIMSDTSFPGTSFRNVQGNISPYIVISFNDIGTDLIESVTIGPKNNTNREIIKAFLKKCGFDRIYDVQQSSASYR